VLGAKVHFKLADTVHDVIVDTLAVAAVVLAGTIASCLENVRGLPEKDRKSCAAAGAREALRRRTTAPTARLIPHEQLPRVHFRSRIASKYREVTQI